MNLSLVLVIFLALHAHAFKFEDSLPQPETKEAETPKVDDDAVNFGGETEKAQQRQERKIQEQGNFCTDECLCFVS